MPKKVLEQNYIRAFNALYGEYVPIEDVTILSSPHHNPEQLLIRKQSYESLSSEAKEMIGVILNSPIEILELLMTPKQKNVTIKNIRKYFAHIWQSQFITDLTIKEVANWVNQL